MQKEGNYSGALSRNQIIALRAKHGHVTASGSNRRERRAALFGKKPKPMSPEEGRRQDIVNRGWWKLMKAFTSYKNNLGGQEEGEVQL